MAAVVVMGVSGSGKTTLGQRLAAALGCAFLEGDELHDARAVAKMAAGRALDDADRAPWLDRVGRALGAAARRDGIAVAACSALKRDYRERLATAAGVPVRFVLADLNGAELERRLAARRGHYMPASLLPSQLATLERPGADEDALVLDAAADPDELVAHARKWIGR